MWWNAERMHGNILEGTVFIQVSLARVLRNRVIFKGEFENKSAAEEIVRCAQHWRYNFSRKRYIFCAIKIYLWKLCTGIVSLWEIYLQRDISPKYISFSWKMSWKIYNSWDISRNCWIYLQNLRNLWKRYIFLAIMIYFWIHFGDISRNGDISFVWKDIFYHRIWRYILDGRYISPKNWNYISILEIYLQKISKMEIYRGNICI